MQEANGVLPSTKTPPERAGLRPRNWPRLAACFLILVGSAAVPFAFMANDEEAARWGEVCPLLCLALMMATALRCETIVLWQRLGSVPILREHWNWFRFCLSSALLVFLVEAASLASYGRLQLVPHVLTVVLNCLLLIFLASVVFAATNRFGFSVVLIYSAYLLAFVANLIKVHYLQAIIRPLDIEYLAAFQAYFTTFFRRATAAGLIALGSLWTALMALLWYTAKYRVRLRARSLLAIFSAVGIVGITYGDKIPPTAYLLKRLGLNKRLSNGVYSAELRGFLFEFVSDIPDSIPRTPENYTQGEVARAVGEHYRLAGQTASLPQPREDVNVVVYMVESFMDPLDLEIKFSSDPIPAFRAATREHPHGYAIVPNECYGSTNTEFELLTGMSCSFLPKGACPYVQFMKREIPSLPAFLRAHGYTTHAVHADKPVLYGRVQVYPHLHFDQTVWLAEGMERGEVPSDIAGRCPADQALVDTITKISGNHRRFFLFAFPNSTHSPYNYDHYRDSDLDVCEPMPESAKKELKTYINALRTADRAIGRLLSHFRHVPQKTIVVIFGDHMPPFGNSAIYAKAGLLQEAEGPALPRRRRVPLLVWSNFRGKGPDLVCSTNFLAAQILSSIGIEPQGFLALSGALRNRVNVLSGPCLQTSDGRLIPWDAAPGPISHLLADYRLLQYDALIGKQYSLAAQ